jgi:1-acyl-sn-glycerol-3-phosphate acyltransferase
MRLVRTLQNWWAWTELVLVVMLGTPVVALIYAVTAPFDPGRYAAGRAFRLVGVTALRLNSLWRFRTRGSLADARRPYVVVANHESYADVFLISCFPWEMKWLSKDTMFKIPFMGWMMRMAGDIKLVRGNRDSAADAILQCRDRLSKKVSVMIFPEGTRSRSWEMLPFKDGAFRLAIESGAPILPIAVVGTRHAMAKGTFRFLPARAIAQVLEPLATAGMTLADVATLKQQTRERIEAGRRVLAAELGVRVDDVATVATTA